MAGQEEEQQQPHPADPGAEKAVSFLPALVAAIQRVHAEQADAISTEVFAVLMDKCAEFFDFMGAVLHAAKHDLATASAFRLHSAVHWPRSTLASSAWPMRGGTEPLARQCLRPAPCAQKTASLHHAAPAHPTLAAVVAADVAAGRATVKDSCTRNLHRLVTTLKFVRLVLAELAGKATCTVREAVKTAYSDVRRLPQ